MPADYGIEEFVQAVYRSAFEGGVRSALENISHPPGRAPLEHFFELNSFHRSLSGEDKLLLAKAMALAADYAVFGLFAIMDGARPITDGFSREIHASLVGEGEILPLAPDEDLHDYFRSIADENRAHLYAHLRDLLADLTSD